MVSKEAIEEDYLTYISISDIHGIGEVLGRDDEAIVVNSNNFVQLILIKLHTNYSCSVENLLVEVVSYSETTKRD